MEDTITQAGHVELCHFVIEEQIIFLPLARSNTIIDQNEIHQQCTESKNIILKKYKHQLLCIKNIKVIYAMVLMRTKLVRKLGNEEN
uniref:Uncharacterized protein n=1 Tax=Arundo donax TaxID=35708 RepID=A0A0A8Z9A7_ARUDO